MQDGPVRRKREPDRQEAPNPRARHPTPANPAGHPGNFALQRAAAPKCERCGESALETPGDGGLAIGPSGDAFEREADAVASRVLGGDAARAPSTLASAPPRAQRLCAACSEEAPIRPKRDGGATRASKDSSAVIAGASGGSAIAPGLRERLEPALGADLGGVRVHDGSEASELAAEMSARAFTYRSHIFLGAGSRPDDLGLMAHEATHVVQQGAAGISNGAGARSIQRSPDAVQRDLCEDPAEIVRRGLGVDREPADPADPANPANPGARTLPEVAGQTLTEAQFEARTGVSANTIPPDTFVGAEQLLHPASTLGDTDAASVAHDVSIAALPASLAGAPLPMETIPPDSIGILWTAGHESIFANVGGKLTIRGYRAVLAMHMARGLEALPGVAPWFSQQLTAGSPGAFRPDSFFARLPAEQNVIFLETDTATAQEFAATLEAREYGGDYRFSPPNPEAAAGSGERAMYERVYQSRGAPRAILCTNNCITVPLAEVETVLGTHPRIETDRGMLDIATGEYDSGGYDPHRHGRASLMRDYMRDPDLSGARPGLEVAMTPAAARAVGYIRVGGGILMVYAVYQTGSRLASAWDSPEFPLVVMDEGFTWAGGMAGTAIGGGAAGALLCSPTGPVTVVCAVGGFLGGLIVGAGMAALGHLVIPCMVRLGFAMAEGMTRTILGIARGMEIAGNVGRSMVEGMIVIPVLAARQSVNPCNWELIGMSSRTSADVRALGLYLWSQLGSTNPDTFVTQVSQPIGGYAVPPALLRDIAAGLSVAARTQTGWNIEFTAEFIAGISPIELVTQLHAYHLLRYRYDPRMLAELSLGPR